MRRPPMTRRRSAVSARPAPGRCAKTCARSNVRSFSPPSKSAPATRRARQRYSAFHDEPWSRAWPSTAFNGHARTARTEASGLARAMLLSAMVPFLLSVLAAAGILLFIVRPIARRAPRWNMPRAARSFAVAAGVAYGLLGRLLFGLGYARWDPGFPNWLTSSFAVMSVSFLFLI